MATQFFIKPIKETTDGKVFARVRRKKPLIDVKLSTNQVFSLAVSHAFHAYLRLALKCLSLVLRKPSFSFSLMS